MWRVLILVALISLKSCAQVLKNDTSDDALLAAQKYVLDCAKKLPAWDVDVLGQYERAEIARVRLDILVCEDDKDVPEFMSHVAQLEEDVRELKRVDEVLHGEDVI
jgi:hypothetical protein